MAEVSPPPWMQHGNFPALNDRQSFAALLGSEGVVDATTGAGDLRVTERSAGADMSVDVTAGRGWVVGDSASFQGYYVVANDAVVNLAVAASDATNPRKDIVIAEVRDEFYTGVANNDWQLRIVTGTAESSPSEPTLPDTALKLAVIDVAAGATSITNADITDTRTQAKLHSPLEREPAAWQTPTFENGWTNLGSGFEVVRFRTEGKDKVRIQGVAAGGSATAKTVFTLPSGFRPSANHIFANDQSTNAHASVEIQSGGSVVNRSGGTPNYLTLNCIYTI